MPVGVPSKLSSSFTANRSRRFESISRNVGFGVSAATPSGTSGNILRNLEVRRLQPEKINPLALCSGVSADVNQRVFRRGLHRLHHSAFIRRRTINGWNRNIIESQVHPK